MSVSRAAIFGGGKSAQVQGVIPRLRRYPRGLEMSEASSSIAAPARSLPQIAQTSSGIRDDSFESPKHELTPDFPPPEFSVSVAPGWRDAWRAPLGL